MAYPNGSSLLASNLLTWNAGHCCGYAMQNKIDDVGFIRNLIDQLARDYPIDPQQVFVTCMSNGGMMTHRLGIELGDKIAAIAPVVATLFESEARPVAPVPALIINGAMDKSVPPEGGPTGGRSAFAWDGTPTQPSAYQATYWANANGCDPEPQSNSTGSSAAVINIWRYTCPRGRDVVHYLIGDNGHAWPGGQPGRRQADTPSPSFNATDVIWDFFKSQADK